VVHGRPKFDAPPVVETVLSVQFANLPGYSTAHAGWFWKEYLEKLGEEPSRKWSQAVDAPRLEDQFERFGAEDIWVVPQLAMKLLPPSQSQRTQIIRSDGERMIQVQDSRFILNWKKQAGAYPSFEPLLDEFRTMLQAFETFAIEARFGKLGYNQWEIAYVDQLKKGDMWESARDWSRIFPGLSMPPAQLNQLLSTGDEAMSADWRFSLTDRRGRMYIQLRQSRIPPSNEEVLNVTWVARGPVTASETWEQGFALGHDAISETFLTITSAEAHERWKERA
jgi:uncharacterized protein (TIGR04255 family)